MSITAFYKYGKPVLAKYVETGTHNAGDVIVVGATPFIAHVDVPSFTGGPLTDALSCEGGIYTFTSDGTPVIGQCVLQYLDQEGHRLGGRQRPPRLVRRGADRRPGWGLAGVRSRPLRRAARAGRADRQLDRRQQLRGHIERHGFTHRGAAPRRPH